MRTPAAVGGSINMSMNISISIPYPTCYVPYLVNDILPLFYTILLLSVSQLGAYSIPFLRPNASNLQLFKSSLSSFWDLVESPTFDEEENP